jgi:hypothetical protein
MGSGAGEVVLGWSDVADSLLEIGGLATGVVSPGSLRTNIHSNNPALEANTRPKPILSQRGIVRLGLSGSMRSDTPSSACSDCDFFNASRM